MNNSLNINHFKREPREVMQPNGFIRWSYDYSQGENERIKYEQIGITRQSSQVIDSRKTSFFKLFNYSISTTPTRHPQIE